MSRPIAYNLPGAAINGSITNEDAVISYVVDGRGNDYFNNYESCNWVPSADGAAPIVFVTDTFTRGYEGNPNLAVPLFFACAGTSSAAILYTANRLPGSPGNYTDANTALNDLNRTYGYFILESNDPFEGINATNLALDVDASKMTSYPQTGTNWYDLSGNGNTSALTNGPTFNSNGWLVFDGVDDYSVGTGTLGQDCTVELWISSSNYNQKIPISIDGANYGSGPNMYFTSNIIAWNTGDGDSNAFSNSSYPNAQWHHIVVTNDYNVTAKLYIDGKLIGTANPLDATTTGANKFWIARFHGDNNYTIAARITAARIYNAALTEAQVKQNYFGSPIVTDGLVFAVDANNIVSYPKSGTPWYNLTGSFSASLVNGPTFDQANGGAISFDGTDEYAAVQYNSALDITTAITVEAWVKYRSQGEIGGSGRTYSVISYKGYPWTWLLEDQSGQFNFRISTTSNADSNINSNYYHGLNNWDHVVCTYDGATQTIYVNGVLKNSQSLTGAINTSATTIELGTYGTGDYSLNGWLANHRIYNRALSAAEIQQNYQAEQYRFETPAGPVTNGLLLYWDAGNLDSYPGTGTTIYDLSGNGNNGTLYNGVGYNQVNGGVLTFDGVDDYVVGGPNLAATNYTVMGAGRYVSIPYVGPPYGAGRLISANSTNWLLGLWGGSTENYYAEGWVSSVAAGTSNTSWRIWTGTGNISGDSYSVYVNNSLTAGPNTGGSAGPNGFSIGRYAPGGDEYSNSNLGFLLAYNRVLTVDEMTQNYNYFKGRFGL